MPNLIDSIRWINVGMVLLVPALIYRRGLWTRYRYFGYWLLTEGILHAILYAVPRSSELHLELWAVIQPALWLLKLLALLEVMALIYEQYPRIGDPAKTITSVSFMVGVGVAFSTLAFGGPGGTHGDWIQAAWIVSRCVSWTVCVVLLVQILFFALFPVPMVPNVVLHRRLFIPYAGCVPGFSLILTTLDSGSHQVWIKMTHHICNILLLGIWAACLVPSREYSPLTHGEPDDPKSGVPGGTKTFSKEKKHKLDQNRECESVCPLPI